MQEITQDLVHDQLAVRKRNGHVRRGQGVMFDSDELWGEHGRRIRFLSRVGLFRHCSATMLAHIATMLQPVKIEPGSIICREGEPGEQLFLIEAGTLVATTIIGGKNYEIATMAPGGFFGEMALLGEGKRTVTVMAKTAASLWSLSAADFDELCGHMPELAITTREVANSRQRARMQGIFEVEHRNLAVLSQGRKEIRIGRDEDNDLVFESPSVAEHHAIVEWKDGTYRLHALSTTYQTYVNRTSVRHTVLKDGDEIWLGSERLVFDRREIQHYVEPRGVRIDVTNLGRRTKKGKKLLQDVSFSILPGEFVAIVGGSGAGKTTLMNALSGLQPATSGRVLYNGRDYYQTMNLYRNALGYVPQDDIIHTELPLRTTLEFAAKLRLPSGTSSQKIDSVVNQTLEALSLKDQASLRVRTLSGGQRKRCSIGVELLTEPRVFFLDEPTSGLDPATDTQMMHLLDRLSNDGSTVVVTTHTTANIMLCDKVIFMARGGRVAFVGSPQRALHYFQVDTFSDIYRLLEDEGSAQEWVASWRSSSDYAQTLADQPDIAGAVPKAHERRSLTAGNSGNGVASQLRQFLVLSRRNFKLYVQNPANLMPLIMQPVVFLLLLLALFKAGTFSLDTSNPAAAVELLFLLAFAFFNNGLLYAVQEIVKEFPIFRRERMVNLGLLPYIFSKVIVLLPILVVMEFLTVLVLRMTDRLPGAGLDVYAQLMLTIFLISFSGLALALFTSAFSSTEKQATDMLALWITPQVLLAGALFAVPSMNSIGQILSTGAATRWSFEALGHITDLNNLFANGSSPIGRAELLQYGDTFSGNLVTHWLILAAFIVVPLVLTCLVLKLRSAAR
jgi:ABC-type multidrug transport system ATPase subunit/CRP-like cAMP-binding protein